MEKQPTAVLGMMSGTSLDGVDAAIVITDGDSLLGFGRTAYRAYSKSEKQVLRAALGKWPDANDLGEAHDVILNAHQELIGDFKEAELIGFHGQTLAHDPENGKTHQLGDGQVLATKVGKPVVWDFRSADIAAGGQGAPLAPFFHFACAKALGAKAPVAFLNLGGVGNVSFVNGAKYRPEQDGAILAFDTGPANAPISDYMLTKRGEDMDKDGALAATGTPDPEILQNLMAHPFFEAEAPKSLDRDSFYFLQDEVANLSEPDAAATLTAAVVATVYAAQMHFPSDPSRWLVCGGGRHNKTIVAGLQQSIEQPVDPVEKVGFNGDMFEAQAFAYLAMRVARGLPTSAPGTTGCREPVCGGILSKP